MPPLYEKEPSSAMVAADIFAMIEQRYKSKNKAGTISESRTHSSISREGGGGGAAILAALKSPKMNLRMVTFFFCLKFRLYSFTLAWPRRGANSRNASSGKMAE